MVAALVEHQTVAERGVGPAARLLWKGAHRARCALRRRQGTPGGV
jgi:hypothetical protein